MVLSQKKSQYVKARDFPYAYVCSQFIQEL